MDSKMSEKQMFVHEQLSFDLSLPQPQSGKLRNSLRIVVKNKCSEPFHLHRVLFSKLIPFPLDRNVKECVEFETLLFIIWGICVCVFKVVVFVGNVGLFLLSCSPSPHTQPTHNYFISLMDSHFKVNKPI